MRKYNIVKFLFKIFIIPIFLMFLTGCSGDNNRFVEYTYYKLTEDTCSVLITYKNQEEMEYYTKIDVKIPDEYNGLKVTEIDPLSYSKECIYVKNLVLGKHIYIDDLSCLNMFKHLENIKVSKQNEHYSSYKGVLYSKDKSTLLYFPLGLRIEDVKTPKNLKILGSYSFQNKTNIHSVVIPDCIEIIDSKAFYNCEGLQRIYFTNNSRLKVIKDEAFFDCVSLVTIDMYEDSLLEEIGDYAFRNCKILEYFPRSLSLSKIGKGAFMGCTLLKKFYFNDKLTIISDEAFLDCGFESLEFPEGITEIGEFSFGSNLELKSVKFPESVVEIKRGAFSNCFDLTTVYLPSNLKVLREGVFASTAIKQIELPKGLEKIEGYVFKGTFLKTINIPKGVTEISDYAFDEVKALESVVLPSTIKKIGKFAFHYCESLQEINLPENVEYIGKDAFSYCMALTSITMHKNVKVIEEYAFASCTALNEINFYGTKEDWDNIDIIVPDHEILRAKVNFINK